VKTGEVRLWKMTRRQVREAMAAGRIKAAILPTGSTEQHNEHLAMEHDIASSYHVSWQAALALYPKVVLATPMAVGISEHWMEFPGTLSLKPETFFAVAFDICESLKRHGIEKVLIINGHAGNGPLGQQMPDFRQRLGIEVRFHSYWEAYSKEFVAQHMESGDCPAHAAEFETSFAQALFPENVHWEGVDYEKANIKITKNLNYAPRDPIYYQAAVNYATAKKGRAMADCAIDWVVKQMEDMLSK
jgi:creatinine amidohydrolase